MNQRTPTADETKLNNILATIQGEVLRASQKHPPMRSFHEGYAILLEEVDELWEAVKLQSPNKDHLREEVIQIAAMAVRFAFDLT